MSEVATELVVYSFCELVLALQIVAANMFVLVGFVHYRRLRTTTNTFIASLAIVDTLTGLLGIPMTVFVVLTGRPSSFYWCQASNLAIVSLCTVSGFHLIVIAVDKYLNICGRLIRHKGSHRRRVLCLLAFAWTAGIVIGCLPIVFTRDSLKNNYDGYCTFLAVVEVDYLVYIIFYVTIVAPTFLITFCYIGIYRKIWREGQTVRQLLSDSELLKRHLQRRNIVKTLVMVVIAFFVCWYPLYLINCVLYYWRVHIAHAWILAAVVLSHVSAGVNPLIYAYSLPGFRLTLAPDPPPAAADGRTAARCCCLCWLLRVRRRLSTNVSISYSVGAGGGTNGSVRTMRRRRAVTMFHLAPQRKTATAVRLPSTTEPPPSVEEDGGELAQAAADDDGKQQQQRPKKKVTIVVQLMVDELGSTASQVSVQEPGERRATNEVNGSPHMPVSCLRTPTKQISL